MKKTLLLCAIAGISQVSFAQLTQANEPAIGESSNMYLCDSNAVSYENITGAGVTWDYAGLGMYPGETRLIGIGDATSSPNYSDFPSATKTLEIEGLLTTFMSSDASSRVSHGFVYTEQTLGDVKAIFDDNSAVLMNYPFAQGSYQNDVYAGNLDFTFNGIPMSPDAAGTIYSTVDGSGTLLFPNETINNVLRFKSVDTALTDIPLFGEMEIVRVQYEYYDLADQNLPIFVHTTVIIQQPGGGTQIGSNTLVLSKYAVGTVGVTEQDAIEFAVFPNPAQDEVTIKGAFSQAVVTIYNAQGQQVLNAEVANGQSINTAALNAGMYLVKVESNGKATVKNLAIR